MMSSTTMNRKSMIKREFLVLSSQEACGQTTKFKTSLEATRSTFVFCGISRLCRGGGGN